MGGSQFCEQLTPTVKHPGDEEDVERLEWKRSYKAAYVKPIQKEAAKETVVLAWDPSSSGGQATFFQVSDDHIVSLIGHVGVRGVCEA